MNCFAERMAGRFCGEGMPYEGLAKMTPSGARWTGKVRLVEERIHDPIRWKRPRRIFVNSMSDLFHERLTTYDMMRVFSVIAKSQHHIFQVLTKRAERMLDWFRDTGFHLPPNVWLGVSVEDQATADERIPLLLECPAAVRWVSYEPALGPVDFSPWLGQTGELGAWTGFGARLDWVVVGCESGPGARSFSPEWARSVVRQCRAAGVPVFVKQIPLIGAGRVSGDPSGWPADLRVREWPK